AVKGRHSALNGPLALLVWSWAIQTCGAPPCRRPPLVSCKANPRRFVPGFIGMASEPVPMSETMVAPAMSAPIEPAGLVGSFDRVARLHAAARRPIPMAARNCRRLGYDPSPLGRIK